MSKNLSKQMRNALDRDSSAARISDKSRFAGQVFKGATHAPRDITQPISGMAREIDLAHVKPDPNQPRKTMTPEGIRDLADSIKENGILQPITVTWSESEKAYLILTGQRRYQAAKKAGLATITAIIRPADYDERQRLQQQLVENIQREGIPPAEEARAIHQLMETLGLSQRDVAKKLGKPQVYVQELLSIINRIPAERLKRAEPVQSKRAMVEIAKATNDDEQEELLALALKSDNPYQAVKEARDRGRRPAASSAPTARLHFEARDQHATVTIRFDRPSNKVSDEDVVSALTAVVQQITGRTVKLLGRKKRGAP